MKIWEAIELAITEEKKVRLSLWPEDEFICYREGAWFDENADMLDWMPQSPDGWEIYEDEEEKSLLNMNDIIFLVFNLKQHIDKIEKSLSAINETQQRSKK